MDTNKILWQQQGLWPSMDQMAGGDYVEDDDDESQWQIWRVWLFGNWELGALHRCLTLPATSPLTSLARSRWYLIFWEMTMPGNVNHADDDEKNEDDKDDDDGDEIVGEKAAWQCRWWSLCAQRHVRLRPKSQKYCLYEIESHPEFVCCFEFVCPFVFGLVFWRPNLNWFQSASKLPI